MLTRGPADRRVFEPAVRIGIVAFIVLVGFAILFIRLGYIQLGQFGGRLTDLHRRMWANLYVQAQRGRIMDREGRLMAASVEGRSLYAHPGKVKDKSKLAVLLARHELLSLEESLERLSSPHSFVWLHRGIDLDRWLKIKNDFSKIDGVGFLQEWRRRYPLNSVGAGLIGFVGADGRGLSGVEYMMDRDLAGDIGSLKVEIGDHGMPVILDSTGRQNPVFRGKDVMLTLDAYVQEAADKVLAEAVEAVEAKGGSVVVAEARTGEIWAMSSYPSFDPNRFSEYQPSNFRNGAINTIFEPGSTFKIVTVAALADVHPSSFQANVVCRGVIQIPRTPHPIRCSAAHGPIGFRQMVEASCNVGIIQESGNLAPDAFFRTIQNLGFGIQTGIGLPGEEKGILRKPYRWSLSSQAAMSIGHEIAVTNLQMTMAMAAIANGGDLIKPVQVRGSRGNGSTKIVRHVFRPDVTRVVQDLMVSAVEGELATGKKAKVEGIRVGGKTGTAQVADPKTGGYHPDRFVSSFVGFFPASPDTPRFVISVVIHEPNPAIAHFGGDVAAPVFSKIAAAVVKLIR